MVRSIKVLHTLGAIGLMGASAALVVMRVAGPAPGAEGHAALRHTIDALFTWLLVPSMLLCIASGFASMFAHKPYWNALWAWLKAFSGMLVLELTFRLKGVSLSVGTPEVAADPSELAEVLRSEWSSVWVLLVACLLNVVVGVWRPKLIRSPVNS